MLPLRLTDQWSTTRSKGKKSKPTVWAHSPSQIGDVCPFFISQIGGFFMKKVAILMGSDSDLPVVKKAADTLASFGVPYEMHVYSAHRTPVQARDFALSARNNGFGVIIAAAGMAAHLAGAIAANTTLPVIGIPMKSSTFTNGIDALLSTVQMPSGIPVATVAVDGAVNAALLSIQILAVEDASLAEKLDAKREADAQKVLEKDAALQ
jgi:5-(carboxyamino)imidazole ribonucleotide mutase